MTDGKDELASADDAVKQAQASLALAQAKLAETQAALAEKGHRAETMRSWMGFVTTLITAAALPMVVLVMTEADKAREAARTAAEKALEADRTFANHKFDVDQEIRRQETDQRRKDADERTNLVLTLVPKVLGSTGSKDNCPMVLAEWDIAYPDSRSTIGPLVAACTNNASPSVSSVEWGIWIGTDALLGYACDEVRKLAAAGYDKVDVYRDGGRFRTIIYGFVDRSSAELAEIGVRAKFRPGLVAAIPHLITHAEKQVCK